MENLLSVTTITEFSEILDIHGLEYIPVEHYWQVGAITRTQGWILHLSVIQSQVVDLLETVIPYLAESKITFKIARDQFVANTLLNGGLGYIHLGKIVTIYAETDRDANKLSRGLIELTKKFSGPAIPTDLNLGGIVYTRYGAFNPILIDNYKNESVKHIYDHAGNLIPDPYSIPFTLPEGINWPFIGITEPMVQVRRKLLNYSYYPLTILKSDAKGDVIKGLYFKKFWQIRSCLIKQGRQHMCADAAGRDIQDRLAWQYQVYQALHMYIPLPNVFDYFTEYGDAYLAMAYIKGKSLRNWIDTIYQGNSWLTLIPSSRLRLIDRLLEILSIIESMHEKGFLHRDITSMNFLIDRNDRIWLIDLELVWSLNSKSPDPPFAQGTSGFMSPEQEAVTMPATIQEDIYGVGALATEFLTNLYPFKLDQTSRKSLQESLFFFSGDREISKCISICQSFDPNERPSLKDLCHVIETYRVRLLQEEHLTISPISANLSGHLSRTIQAGLAALSSQDLAIAGLGWCSERQRKEDRIGNQQMELALYEGWHTGMAGPLWLVARAKGAGFNVENCMETYCSSWQYIHTHCFENPAWSNCGLYTGLAGIALAMAEGLNSGLLQASSENLMLLQSCFSQPSDQLNFYSGLAGQGLALLAATEWMEVNVHTKLLSSYIQLIIRNQRPDGSWDTGPTPGKGKDIIIGLEKGVAGITWFLLACYEKYPDEPTKLSVEKALKWLLNLAKKKDKKYTWRMSTSIHETDNGSTGYGTLGILLLFIKASKILGVALYGEIVRNSLLPLTSRPVYMNFSQDGGLAGLGEVYLEAETVLKDPVWKERADWIAGVLSHCMKKHGEESGIWLTGTSELSTADLFTGNTGILHFLIRTNTNDRISHPLWPL